MPLTKSAARTKVRQRIRDTVTTYEYSDALLDTYLAPALKEVAVAVREVDLDYYLRSSTIRGYSDALDPGASGTQAYEFYPLPADFNALRWVERFDDSVVQYRMNVSSARDQEGSRHAGRLFSNRVGVYNKTLGTTTYYNQGYAIGHETVAIHGNRLRVVPPPTAAGPTWRIWYSAEPTVPTGEAEPLDIPAAFEEALIRQWGFLPVSDDGNPIAGPMGPLLVAEFAKAKRAHSGREQKSLVIGDSF